MAPSGHPHWCVWMYQSKVILRSCSTADCISMNDQAKIEPAPFNPMPSGSLKYPDIVYQLQQITQPRRQKIPDLISSEIHKQLKPLKDELETKDKEIKALKKTIMDKNAKLVYLEHHGWHDSLRFSGIPVKVEMMAWTQASWPSVVQYKSITRFSHETSPYRIELVRLPQGKPRQVLVQCQKESV